MKKTIVLFILVFFVLLSSAGAAEFKRLLGPILSSYSRPWPGPFSGNYPYLPADGSTLSPFRNSRFSFFGGLGLEFPLSRMLEVEVEVLYKEAGGQYRFDTGFFDSYRYEFQLRELSFPLLLKTHFWKKSRPYFLAGADPSFVLSHRYQLFHRSEAGWIFEKVEEADIKSYTAKSDLALVLGLGFEAAVNKRRVAVECRYELGLANLYRGSLPGPENQSVRVRSRQLLLVISYAIE
ncbi:MAG: PorT family protein [Candidatus Saccharicenans sp.]|nr:PorT family protein [Candidatus Saccharicenans sp.]